MSTPEPPPSPWAREPDDPWPGDGDTPFAAVGPLRPEDPPRVGGWWLDARLTDGPAGVAYTAHDSDEATGGDRPAMLVLLSEGATADAAARERFAGLVDAMHLDTVLARGGHGQSGGRLGRRYRADADAPVSPDGRLVAPWVALAYDGSAAASVEARRLLAEVQLAATAPLGTPAGPDYQHYWVDRVKPGLARLWPLPWPGAFTRVGWRTIVVSWLLMLLLAALAVLIAILIFRNQPPQTTPPPTGQSGSPPPSASASPQSGSPSPQSGSPSPQSASPSSGSPSPSGSQSGSPSPSDSQSGSASASPSPSGSESGSASPSPSGGPGESPSGTLPPSESPRSRL